MSLQLISRSADLRKLRDEGYEVEVRDNHLILHNIPYVNERRQVKFGQLVSPLKTSADDIALPPADHVVHFVGTYPCDHEGKPLTQIVNDPSTRTLSNDIVVNFSFSSKPPQGYPDFFEKMTAYANILESRAQHIDPTVNARTRQVIESEDDTQPFEYRDMASTRAGIFAVSQKLEDEVVAIIGLGGTGSYVLDFVSKTPVKEVRLFDGDVFDVHNAFRAPGAASVADLRAQSKKVEYLRTRYAPMRRNIVAHATHIDASNLSLLEGVTFAFVCVDRGDIKAPIFSYLEAKGIPFIDAGMGLHLVDGSLLGTLRVTTSTPEMRAHVRENKRIGFESGDDDNIYSKNIQIAELNALTASLAVIRWKKLRTFYVDLEREHHCTYTTDGNTILNEDTP